MVGKTARNVVSGSQLDCLLEQQFVLGRMLYPSASVTYRVDPAGAAGTAAEPCTGTRVGATTIGGAPVDPARSSTG